MNVENTSMVYVYFVGDAYKTLVGRLATLKHQLFFEYDETFIKKGLQLSPFKLPLKAGAVTQKDFVFDGLFGVFNDSLPDGWGRLLLDRKLMKLGLNPTTLSPLQRLCYVGSTGMGALVYEPETSREIITVPADFDEIAREIKVFQENDDDNFVDNLLNLGGSSAGARPKILIPYDGEDWIIKFRSYIDPIDIGNIEYAYHLMAVKAKLCVPEAKLFPSKKGKGYFGVKRFDRVKGQPIHMHTLSGLLHADHRIPSLDYETIMKVTLLLTRHVQECEKQFRAAVFNILSHNRDDHAKNFSFLMSEKGLWTLSPAYDLTFSSGPNGEHCTLVMGEGKNPDLSHLLKLANAADIKKIRAIEIIAEVKEAVLAWTLCAEEAGVSKTSLKMIQTAIEKGVKTID